MAGKYHRGGAKTNVMLALLAVLFVSLGYLSGQKKEGFECPNGQKRLNQSMCPK
jgi:hypothetical protein